MYEAKCVISQAACCFKVVLLYSLNVSARNALKMQMAKAVYKVLCKQTCFNYTKVSLHTACSAMFSTTFTKFLLKKAALKAKVLA
jgi:hypothetical protein